MWLNTFHQLIETRYKSILYELTYFVRGMIVSFDIIVFCFGIID